MEQIWLLKVAVNDANTFEGTGITDDGFLTNVVLPELRTLTIQNTPVNESFLRILSQQTALEFLSLSEVTVEGVDHTDPALGHFTTLRKMRLNDVIVDGVDLIDSASDSFTERLRKELQQSTVVISSSTSERRIEWFNF